MKKKMLVGLLLSAFVLSCSLTDGFAVTLLEKKDALKLMLPNAKDIITEVKTLTPGQKQMIKAIWKWQVKEDTHTFYIGESEGKTTGVAYIIDQPGKHAPLLIIIGMEPDGKVRGVAIMEYREQRGRPVKEEHFLKQYIGKTSRSPLKIGKDIDAITGVTTSSRAVTIAVKKALILYEALFLQTEEELRQQINTEKK